MYHSHLLHIDVLSEALEEQKFALRRSETDELLKWAVSLFLFFELF